MNAAQEGRLRIAWGVLLLVLVPPAAFAETLASDSRHALAADPPARVVYRKGLDLPLIGAGTGLLLTGALLTTDRRFVPSQGLDPAPIKLELDRRTVGNRDANAGDLSDALRDGSLAFPLAVRLATSRRGDRLRSTGNVALLYAEAVGLSEGMAIVIKKLVSRPRPYTYLPSQERPGGDSYDADRDQAFQSFPSGHATIAWCAASFGIVDHLSARPGAGWGEHAAIAFAGTALATAVSALRVEAGQHFPSDALAGSAIGIAGGAAVPLVHRYLIGSERAPAPRRSAWVATAVGASVGVVSGMIAANAAGSN